MSSYATLSLADYVITRNSLSFMAEKYNPIVIHLYCNSIEQIFSYDFLAWYTCAMRRDVQALNS